jgi:hypothetical protein
VHSLLHIGVSTSEMRQHASKIRSERKEKDLMHDCRTKYAEFVSRLSKKDRATRVLTSISTAGASCDVTETEIWEAADFEPLSEPEHIAGDRASAGGSASAGLKRIRLHEPSKNTKRRK